MAWTAADDVLDGWVGGGAPDDPVKVGVWIDRAERLIRKKVPSLQARLDAEAACLDMSSDLLDTVRDVVAEMVTEVFLNPDRKRSVQSTQGPFSESTTFGGDNPGRLVVTPEQLALLAPDGGSAGRAFSIDMIPVLSPYSPFYEPGFR
ncbi:hypothetical protein N9A08_12840 [Arthrobacter koreensis]|uniref:Phage protein Gp19/Gp15/Gp42 n=1 Tax=Arthrobacter koreensis TaxID=199136 RepID=A0ABY6FQS7_9MICC|nr:hypothetical protein [Arthrobacter koreensis]UYB35503.1 hypothetical protein N9A08_12840 [Arthrobacter koreensis]